MSVIRVTNQNFKNEVLESSVPVLVDFYADWCGPCRMLRPSLDAIAAERSDVKVAAVNVDEEAELAIRYGIASIPCVILFKDGEAAEKSVGLVPKESLEALLN
ncbi:MAG: thioredoxin [Clostridia bacterium]|nr:thioredoxin [Clostridia bacterium]